MGQQRRQARRREHRPRFQRLQGDGPLSEGISVRSRVAQLLRHEKSGMPVSFSLTFQQTQLPLTRVRPIDPTIAGSMNPSPSLYGNLRMVSRQKPPLWLGVTPAGFDAWPRHRNDFSRSPGMAGGNGCLFIILITHKGGDVFRREGSSKRRIGLLRSPMLYGISPLEYTPPWPSLAPPRSRLVSSSLALLPRAPQGLTPCACLAYGGDVAVYSGGSYGYRGSLSELQFRDFRRPTDSPIAR